MASRKKTKIMSRTLTEMKPKKLFFNNKNGNDF